MRVTSIISIFYQIIKSVFFLLVAAFLIRYVLIEPFFVDGVSMEPSFHDKDYLLVNRLTFRFVSPKRGDVIIFHPLSQTSSNFIKRIIGLPGENVEIHSGRVYINKKPLSEPYLKPNETTLISSDVSLSYERKLGENEFFVLGDNRHNSDDSRSFGPLPRTNLVGRAFIRIVPLKDFRFFGRVRYAWLINPALAHQ